MKERAFRADAREAKGLHDGSVTCLVRVVEFESSGPVTVMHKYDRPYTDSKPGDVWWNADHQQEGRVFVEHDIRSPFAIPGDRLRAVCEPGEPCEHRGCLSHVTHVCEGCGRGHAGILLDVTDVRVVRAQDVEWKDMEDAGLWKALPEYRNESCIWRDSAEVLGRLRIKYFRKLIGEDVFDANAWLWMATVAKVETQQENPCSS